MPRRPTDHEEFEDDFEPEAEVDLHRMPPEKALRRLGQELHACRLRRMRSLLVITGRGWGNLAQKPVLRPRVEEWLRGPDGQRAGVERIEITALGGALIVWLKAR